MIEIGWFALNVGTALLLGMAIGLERQYRQRTAGLRTNALVCLGSALFVSLSHQIDHDSSPTRVAGQVASGIGFLGGGVILREGLNVRGMNTAATLWCSAAIGTLAGMGLRLEAAIGAAAVLLAHLALRPVVRHIDARVRTAAEVETSYRVKVICQEEHEAVIRAIFLRHVNAETGMAIQGLSSQEIDTIGKTAVVAEVFCAQRNDRYLNDLVSRMSIEHGVSSVSWERVEN